MADPLDHNQAEPKEISTLLDVEKLDVDLYRSRNLFLPYFSRGVFGGQVISQSLVAATSCVKPEFALHSLHAYFLLSASASAPLLYYVDRLRDGRTYATRSVRAEQGGQVVFVMTCSFQIPEPSQHSRQWSMPQVPRPEDCKSDVEHIRDMAWRPDTTEEDKTRLLDYAISREESPIYVKHAALLVDEPEGRKTIIYWMKAKTSQRYPSAFQKCILAYISDLNLQHIGSGYYVWVEAKYVKWAKGPGYAVEPIPLPDVLQMTSPVAAQGRAVCCGFLYSQDGALLAVANQEGVIRAKEPLRPDAKM